MRIEDIPQDTRNSFEKENQMTFEEAISHVSVWIKERNFPTAESWIAQIEKYAPDLDKLEELQAELRKEKTGQMEWNASTLEQKSEAEENKFITEKAQALAENPSKEWERMISAVSYLWLFWLIPLLIKRDSEYCQHHWKQWLIIWISLFFISYIFSFIFFITALANITMVIVAIYWWIKAYKWELWYAPIVWDLIKKINK